MEPDDSPQEEAGSADDHSPVDPDRFPTGTLAPEHAPEPPPSPGLPGYWDLLQALVFALVSLGLCIALAGVAIEIIKRVAGAQISMSEGPTQLLSMLIVQGVWWALVMAFLYYIVVLKHGMPFAEGVNWLPVGSKLKYIAGGFAMAIAVTALANILPMPDEPSPLEVLLEEAKRYLPLFVVFGVLIAPAVEEVVFRGFVFGILERAHGVKAAIVATAALFAAPHSTQYGGHWQIIVILFLVGVVLGVVRARTGSTLATTYLHAAYNTTFMIAMVAAEIAPPPLDV